MIQLKIRTEYHFGQTYAKVDDVINRLKEIGCTAAGIVDKSTWGHVVWHKACLKAGIQPILGVEIAVTDDINPTKMWFLAKNQEGLKELYNFNSMSYHQPIKDPKFGDINRLYMSDVINISKTNNVIIFAGDILDGEFLSECNAVIDLNPSSIVLNQKKKQIAEKYELRIVSTSDNAFSYPDDEDVFSIISRSGKKMSKQYIMDELDFQDQAELIAMQCPAFDFQKAPTIREDGDLEALCRKGIKERGMEQNWNQKYEDRLRYELDLIKSKDFESYFIIVADMVQYAKKHMLVGPSRGSSAGSLVCYLARITEIDPIPPGLYFERFIDVSRSDLPDIDLDFPDKKRHIVFEYMANKYGQSNVAHIGTVGFFRSKNSLDTTCKALEIPLTMVYKVKTAMIERSAADARSSNCLEDTLTQTEPGKEFLKMYPDALISCRLEGHAKQVGIHAAGLLICNDKITNYCTVDNNGIAHVDKKMAEELNLLKIDVLGLRTLTILEESGVPLDWYNMPLDDKEVLDMFGSGRLCGLFQFDGNAMRSLAKLVEFKSIVEVDNVTALARPGPYGAGIVYPYVDRKKGLKYEALHPLVEECMRETCGLPLYQEQTIAIVRDIGKFNWEETTQIRKGISKSQGDQFMNKYLPQFLKGAASEGISEIEAKKIWRLINSMGSWQMNKCVVGKTLVRTTANNTGNSQWEPIENLYKKYVENPSAWIKQYKSMPRLLSLYPDGRGRAQKAKNIFKNGEKHCIKLIFDDNTSSECTREHKFLINDKWMACGFAEIGDSFTFLERDYEFHIKKGLPAKGKKWNIKDNDRTGSNNISYTNGKTKLLDDFKKLMAGKPCQHCSVINKRMEVHHNDLDYGNIRPDDLSWLCSGCHKKEHHSCGDHGVPFDKGHRKFFKKLIAVEDAGIQMTYDIEMPEHHNYVIDGGLVTHNSHTFSYAVISYWCAYLKRYHTLEFAASTLRNAKDDDSALELLRELSREGIQFTPFDIDLSEETWSVKDGMLLGGFTALIGIGEQNANKFVALRNEGKLSESDKEKILKKKSKFDDIFPFHGTYQDMYDNPSKFGIAGEITDICEYEEGRENLPHGCERVFIAELVHKNSRDNNEEMFIKKRGGKIAPAPHQFIDMKFRDDTELIGARIKERDFERIGREILDKIPLGAHMLVRAKFFNGVRYAFVVKWKWLNSEDFKK